MWTHHVEYVETLQLHAFSKSDHKKSSAETRTPVLPVAPGFGRCFFKVYESTADLSRWQAKSRPLLGGSKSRRGVKLTEGDVEICRNGGKKLDLEWFRMVWNGLELSEQGSFNRYIWYIIIINISVVGWFYQPIIVVAQPLVQVFRAASPH